MSGIFGSFGAMSGQFAAKQERGQVAKALVEELQVAGTQDALIKDLQQNAPELLRQWRSGVTSPVPSAKIDSILGKSDLIQKLSQRTQMPPGVVKASAGVLLPIAVHHLAAVKTPPEDGPQLGSLSDPESLLQALQ